MPKIEIHCKGCGLYLGEIRDATLRKEIAYLCKNCNIKRLASDLAGKTSPKVDMPDFLNNLFRGSK